jgi:glycogen operon protein
MLVAGDEMWRTQRGNNNAYVQGNEVSWIDWKRDEIGDDVLALTRRLLGLRRAHPVLRQRAFFEGHPVLIGDGYSGTKDLAWFHPAGRELSEDDWFDSGLRSVGMYLDGRGLRHRNARGETIKDDSFLLLLHSGDADGVFTIPGPPWAGSYKRMIDTSEVGGEPAADEVIPGGAHLPMRARSVQLLRVVRDATS